MKCSGRPGQARCELFMTWASELRRTCGRSTPPTRAPTRQDELVAIGIRVECRPANLPDRRERLTMSRRMVVRRTLACRVVYRREMRLLDPGLRSTRALESR